MHYYTQQELLDWWNIARLCPDKVRDYYELVYDFSSNFHSTGLFFGRPTLKRERMDWSGSFIVSRHDLGMRRMSTFDLYAKDKPRSKNISRFLKDPMKEVLDIFKDIVCGAVSKSGHYLYQTGKAFWKWFDRWTDVDLYPLVSVIVLMAWGPDTVGGERLEWGLMYIGYYLIFNHKIRRIGNVDVCFGVLILTCLSMFIVMCIKISLGDLL